MTTKEIEAAFYAHSEADENYVLQIGMFKGHTLKEVLSISPEYIVWAADNLTHIRIKESLLKEAKFQADMNAAAFYEFEDYPIGNYGFWES